jgi:arylsulfatase B
VYEGGHRVPCFIHWPAGGIKQDVDVAGLTAHTDLLPTLVDFCGLKTPERGHLPLDGRSLKPLLEDGDAAWPDRLIVMHQQNVREVPVKGMNAVVATEKWRLINGRELYDIQSDPGQENDVAAAYPEVVADLSERYDDHWDELQMGHYPYPRPIIGSGHDEETWLTADALILDQTHPHTWNQLHVLQGADNSGFWPVEIASEGLYRFDVRRWPKELNHPISAFLPGEKSSDIYKLGQPVRVGEGKSIAAVKVRLRVGDRQEEKKITPEDVSALFEMGLRPGPNTVRAWTIDAEGFEQGAYYVYVTKVSDPE